MDSVTKEKLSIMLKNKLGLSASVCNSIVTSIFNNIINIIVTQKSLKIKNFGSFTIAQKNKRPGMNLNTKEIVQISARKIIKFTPSRNLKSKLNNQSSYKAIHS